MMSEPKYPSGKLTVVFRDDGPMIHCGDCPTYRSVQITLTDEQVRALAMRPTYNSGATQFHEEISRCFIEPDETPIGPSSGRE
jgi:hypothetical protein